MSESRGGVGLEVGDGVGAAVRLSADNVKLKLVWLEANNRMN